MRNWVICQQWPYIRNSPHCSLPCSFLSLNKVHKISPQLREEFFKNPTKLTVKINLQLFTFLNLNIGKVWIHRLWCYVWLTQRPISQSNTIVELNKRTLRVLAKILAKLIFKFQYYALMGKNCKWYIIHFKDKILFTPPYQ